MEITVHTITSRFLFTLPHIDRDAEDARVYSDDDEGSNAAAETASSSHARVAHRQSTSSLEQRDATEMGRVLTGAYAFVPAGAAPALSSLLHSTAPGHSRGDARRAGSAAVAARASLDEHQDGAPQLPDLLRIASRSWNVELCRGATGAPSHCVLRTPPYLVDGVLYGGATVQVLASGVVRMMTRGSVHATHVLAQRVRDALQEACVPRQARRAAREERLLLRHVLRHPPSDIISDDDADEQPEEGRLLTERAGSAAPQRAPVQRVELVRGTARAVGEAAPPPSLAAALAGADPAVPLSGTDGAALRQPPPVSATRASPAPQRADHVHAPCCTIDFVQAVATPRWIEIARLRDDLFGQTGAAAATTTTTGDASAADAAAAAEAEVMTAQEGVEGGDAERESENDQPPPQQDGPPPPSSASGAPAAVARQPGPVRRASVNVSGDAPLAWWRWFLRGPAGTIEEGHTGGNTARSRASKVKAAKAEGEAGADEAPAAALQQTRSDVDGDGGFGVCAGHKSASAAASATFVRYLQHQRARLAHHLVAFTVRRHTSMHSLQLALEWRSTEPPPRRPPAATQPLHPLASALRGTLVSGGGLRLSLSPAAPASASMTVNPGATRTSGTAHSSTNGGPQWVTEASAAHFFTDSTFIAESTTPYGLESVRVDCGDDAGTRGTAAGTATTALGELPVVASSGGWTSRTTSPADALTAAAAPPSPPSSFVVQSSAATPTAPAKRSRRGGAVTSGLTSSALHDGLVEHVTCVLHSTGRVSLTAASEAALRQLCEVLLIPFLVATANIT